MEMSLLPLTLMCSSLLSSVCGFTVLSYPDQLFNARIVDGSNLRLFCEASSTSSSLTMTWTINGNTITDNHPRIRQTRATIGEKTLFTLAVDNFMIIDAGSYSCSARIGSTTRQGNTFALSFGAAQTGVLQLVKFQRISHVVIAARTFAYSGTRFRIESKSSYVDAYSVRESLEFPTVTWLVDGKPIRSSITEAPQYGTGLERTSTLDFTFAPSTDAGTWLCLFHDTQRNEYLVAGPLVVGTGPATLERVTPDLILLQPPEMLVLEVRTSGGYYYVQWTRNGAADYQSGFPTTDASFAGHREVYFKRNTGNSDIGLYSAELLDLHNQNGILPSPVEFAVIRPVQAMVTRSGSSSVTVMQGGNVAIACSVEAIPQPTMTWTYQNAPPPFTSTEGVRVMRINRHPNGISVTSANVESTLYIINAQQIHAGRYYCTGSNEIKGQTYTDQDSFIVHVQGATQPPTQATNPTFPTFPSNPSPPTVPTMPTGATVPTPPTFPTFSSPSTPTTQPTPASTTMKPETLSVTADISPPGSVVLGSTVNLVCVATSGTQPITFSWTNSDGAGIFPGDTDGTISVTFSSSTDYGTYTCSANNVAGTTTADVEVIQGLLFQIRLLGITNCEEWRMSGNEAHIVQEVPGQLSCACEVQISDPVLLCFPEASGTVTFRGKASAGNEPVSMLTNSIRQWITSGPTMLIQSQLFRVDVNCTIWVSSFAAPGCKALVPEVSSSGGIFSNMMIIYIGAGSGGGLLLLVFIIVVAVIIVKRRRNAFAAGDIGGEFEMYNRGRRYAMYEEYDYGDYYSDDATEYDY